jgi:quinol-cytochrome oxidoreductase complex cytochrome b subunit
VTDVDRGRRAAAWGAVVLTGAMATAVAVTGFLLADRYRPGASFGDPERFEPGRLVEVNEAVIGVLSGLALALVMATVVPRVRRAFRLSWWSAGAAVVAFVATFTTGVTRDQVQYDQLGLWAVTAGTDVEGYRVVTGEDVRFAVVNGTEVTPSTYEAVLVVHLAAPLVVLVALAVIGWDLRRRRPPAVGQNSRSVVDSMPRSSS